jgi:hypothetical protein
VLGIVAELIPVIIVLNNVIEKQGSEYFVRNPFFEV